MKTKTILIVSGLSVGYLLLSYVMVGFKQDQLVLIALFNSLFYVSVFTRKLILGFSIFLVYWIIYDYMKAFPNYNFNEVHIQDLYNTEKHLFGIFYQQTLLTPNEYWYRNGNVFLDIISGAFYLCWVPVPLVFAAYLFFRNRREFINFSLTFLLVNLLGFVVYYTYPAAPPWYVQHYGFEFRHLIMGNMAGLSKFDDFFGIHLFQSIYAKGSNVFAAMPSLHSAYPLIVSYFAFKNKLGYINVVFGVIALGIWFAAVYTSHHYVLDVLAGILCAITGIILFQWLSNLKPVNDLLQKYTSIIE